MLLSFSIWGCDSGRIRLRCLLRLLSLSLWLRSPITIWEIRSLGRWAVQVFWFLLGSGNGRRPNPTPDSNPNSKPDPKPQPKRGKTGHKRGCAAFASNQEISQLRTTIPKCRPRYAIFKSKTPLKILPPRLLNLLLKSAKNTGTPLGLLGAIHSTSIVWKGKKNTNPIEPRNSIRDFGD